MKSTTTWIDGFKSTVDDGRGHEYTIDLPPGKGGTDEGPTALDLAVMGLSGCVVTIFALVAKNSKLDFTALKAVAEADKGDTDKTITTAKVVVTISTTAERNRVEKVLEKTMAVCPVGVLFVQAGIIVGHELIIE